MTLHSTPQIKANLAQFIQQHKAFNYEKGQSQPFWTAFFQAFGVPANVYGLWYENTTERKFIDVFYHRHFIIEQKSEGRSLDEAFSQAVNYAQSLPPEIMPRFIIVSDFKQFRIKNLATSELFEFGYEELEDKIQLWREILGEEVRYKEEITVNSEAANLMADLHDAVKASGYGGQDLEILLIRLLFCLFADDTGIFNKGIFQTEMQNAEPKYLGAQLGLIFNLLNQPLKDRPKNLDESLNSFPYVNGGLFSQEIAPVTFTAEMKNILLAACAFDWAKVSPIIFGSIFQHAMDPKERRNFGAHFTTVENIRKALDPLFLNELREEFARIASSPKNKNRTAQLQGLMQKIGGLVILDPACGCGNFLSVAYCELRTLENAIIREAYKKGDFDNVGTLSQMHIGNFYGIEIGAFAAYVARVSMWLVEHQMNTALAKMFGTWYAKLPLDDEAHIVQGNALALNWGTEVLRGKTPNYIVGNPPFVGKQFQTAEQKADVEAVFAGNPKARTLDYVACWYKKAAEYLKAHAPQSQCAFVSTNSITQGEQVSILWNGLFNLGLSINFAHRTFRWTTEISGGAAVYVVIIGFALFSRKDKTLFDYPNPVKVNEYLPLPAQNINGYLVNGANVAIEGVRKPLCDIPPMDFGNMPNDGGNLLLLPDEKQDILKKYPQAKKWIRPAIGADKFINGKQRYCLWLEGISPAELRAMPEVMKRVEAVKKLRSQSTRDKTRELAKYPMLFGEIREGAIKGKAFIAIPGVSSENRQYIPMGFEEKGAIILNSMLAIFDAPKWLFALLTSQMHMAWMRAVAGRLKSDYRYAKDIVYNTFPFPQTTEAQKEKLTQLAEAVLAARAAFPDSSLADLYNPASMPPALRKAHTAIDSYVDKLYQKTAFPSDAERVALLLERYQEMTSLFKAEKGRGKRNKK